MKCPSCNGPNGVLLLTTVAPCDSCLNESPPENKVVPDPLVVMFPGSKGWLPFRRAPTHVKESVRAYFREEIGSEIHVIGFRWKWIVGHLPKLAQQLDTGIWWTVSGLSAMGEGSVVAHSGKSTGLLRDLYGQLYDLEYVGTPYRLKW